MGGIQFLRLVCIFFNFNLGLIFLANNHIQDLSDGISSTLRALARNGFTAFGAGSNLCEAANFVTISSGKQKFIILGFGWPVIGCIPAQRCPVQLAPRYFKCPLCAVQRGQDATVDRIWILVLPAQEASTAF